MALTQREHRILNTVLGPLEDAGVITLDPDQAEKCCGIERDQIGRCQHRPHHPIYVRIPED